MARLAFVHTVGSLAPTFEALARDLDPEVEVVHTVDEALLAEAIAAGSVPEATEARLAGHIADALSGGADLVVVTCSSMGGATDAIAARTGWPVARIDEAMADRALELGARIGVLATLRTTLVPTVELLRRRAGDPPIELTARLAEGAFAALRAGDRERHDALVTAAFRDLLGEVDVIVLAQASMARVADALGAEAAGTPIRAEGPRGPARPIGGGPTRSRRRPPGSRPPGSR
jgi:Asp/Glu/hydantoin racemase